MGNRTETFTLTLKNAGDQVFTVVIKPATGTELTASTTVKVEKKEKDGPGFAAVGALLALAAVAAVAVVALRRRK